MCYACVCWFVCGRICGVWCVCVCVCVWCACSTGTIGALKVKVCNLFGVRPEGITALCMSVLCIDILYIYVCIYVYSVGTDI